MTKAKKDSNSFILDASRQAFLNAIHNRLARGKSVLLVGKFGCGKTELLGHIKPKGKKIIRVNALGSPYQIMGGIVGVGRPSTSAAYDYMLEASRLTDVVVILDEANLLRRSVFPYLKQCMDAGIPFILAGKPDVEDMLREKFEDILSRLKVLRLSPLSAEDYKQKYPTVEPEAVELIYGACLGNMRRFEEVVEDCLDYTNGKMVTIEVAGEFL